MTDETWFDDQSAAAEAQAMAALASVVGDDDESFVAGVVDEGHRPQWLDDLLATHRARFVAGEGLTCAHRQDYNVPGVRYAASLFPGFVTCTDPGCVPLFAQMIERTGLAGLFCASCGAVEQGTAIGEASMRIGWTLWQLFLCGPCMDELRVLAADDPDDFLGG